MSTIKLNEQLLFLRKQKNITQEELAQVLNVTNQAVSKWESGSNCPDINLLPEIAKYFNVSIDELLGYKPADTVGDIFLKIKALFQETPNEECFDLAYELAFLACAKGYKNDYESWDTNEEISKQEGNKYGEFYKWGMSVLHEPKGQIIIKGSNVFISKNDPNTSISASAVREIYKILQAFTNKDNLRVMYALYELTLENFDFVSIEEIAAKCKLATDVVEKALDDLPVQLKELEDGSHAYHMADMYIPAMLTLITDKF